MESLAALGVASNIIQIVDFSSRIISRGHELYRSADGQAAGHVVLESAANNLLALLGGLERSKVHRSPEELTVADLQLVALQTKTETAVNKLRQYLQDVQVTGGNRSVKSIQQALKSLSTDKEISRLANELDNIRKQVDTVLLVSMR